MKPTPTPEGAELIAGAVHAWEAAKKKVVDHEAAVAKKRAELADAEGTYAKAKAEVTSAHRRLLEIAAASAHTAANGCDHDHVVQSVPTRINGTKHTNGTNGVHGETNGTLATPLKATPLIPLEDENVPIKWRLLSMLLVDPILDYQGTAERLWGPADKTTAKNRLNAHIQELRKSGLVETQGSNKFKVITDKLATDKLAHRYGLRVEAPS